MYNVVLCGLFVSSHWNHFIGETLNGKHVLLLNLNLCNFVWQFKHVQHVIMNENNVIRRKRLNILTTL